MATNQVIPRKGTNIYGQECDLEIPVHEGTDLYGQKFAHFKIDGFSVSIGKIAVFPNNTHCKTLSSIMISHLLKIKQIGTEVYKAICGSGDYVSHIYGKYFLVCKSFSDNVYIYSSYRTANSSTIWLCKEKAFKIFGPDLIAFLNLKDYLLDIMNLDDVCPPNHICKICKPFMLQDYQIANL